MSEFELIMVYVIGLLQGAVFGYIMWAPSTPFKEGFVEGLSFKFLRRNK